MLLQDATEASRSLHMLLDLQERRTLLLEGIREDDLTGPSATVKHLELLQSDLLSTRIKDAGIAIRHSQGYIISILQGPEMSLGAVDPHTKGSCTQEKYTFFL